MPTYRARVAVSLVIPITFSAFDEQEAHGSAEALARAIVCLALDTSETKGAKFEVLDLVAEERQSDLE